MIDEKRLELIQEMKDRAYTIYDNLRFSSAVKDYKRQNESFDNIRDIMRTLDELTVSYLSTLPNCFQILVSENTIVHNEETVEVKTNISGVPLNKDDVEVILVGSIPSSGFLGLECEFSELGTKVFVKNKVPKKVWDEHDICGYHYCSPTITRYFSPGVYCLESGQPLGILVKKKMVEENNASLSFKPRQEIK